MKNRNIIVGIVVILVVLGFFVFSQQRGSESGSPSSAEENSSVNSLIPVNEITHGHGLAVDVGDPNKLYIATHHGLLVLINEKDLYRIGGAEDDYMGFSPHPNNQKVFFTSGHPSFGGNLGFQKSEDGGVTWKKVSNGINGPVDFHTMAVSPVNSNIVYGWYNGALQRSADEGKNWTIIPQDLSNVISLVASPTDENVVYAATVQGLMISNSKGENWDNLSDELTGTAVTVLSINPQNSQKMLSFSQSLGLAKSSDGGKTWEKIKQDFGQDLVFYIAFDKQTSNTTYLLTKSNRIYKSTDNWDTWNVIR